MLRLIRVAGDSMAPTYRSADLLLARSVGSATVRRGDVVVFRRGALRLIKRVAGVPGDRIEMEAGRLFVTGASATDIGGADDGYRSRGAYTQTWRVPASSYFMAGDNPGVSDDSRVWTEPFVAVGSVDAVVTRRLPGFRAGRRAVAAARAA